MGKDEVVVSGKDTIVTYAWLYNAARYALEQAVDIEQAIDQAREQAIKQGVDIKQAVKQAVDAKKGTIYHNCLCSIVMSAFCFEAYANDAGMEDFPDWEKWEKSRKELGHKPSSLDKLERVVKKVGIPFDKGIRPFCSLQSAKELRDEAAHGRTKVIDISYTEELSRKGPSNPSAPWQEKCTTRFATSCLEDVYEVITEVHKKRDKGELPFLVVSRGIHAKELK